MAGQYELFLLPDSRAGIESDVFGSALFRLLFKGRRPVFLVGIAFGIYCNPFAFRSAFSVDRATYVA